MEYNQDTMMVTHNTFGDRFELWHEGEPIVTCDLDGSKLFTTWKGDLNVHRADALLIRALAGKVMQLESQVQALLDELEGE